MEGVCMKRTKTSMYAIAIVLGILAGYQTDGYAQSTSPLITEAQPSLSLHIYAPAFMEHKVSINADHMSLKKLLLSLENQAGIEFSYRENTIPEQKQISIRIADIPLNKALSKIFEGTNIYFIPVKDRYVILKKREVGVRQGSTISGVVTDRKTGESLPGANVALQGTQQGAAADANGHYEIRDVAPGTYTLVARFIGYQPARKLITVKAGKNIEVSFKLVSSAVNLNELVVIGYGEQKRSNITGAISSVSADEISSVSNSGLQGALQGRVAGLNVTPSTGQPGAPANIVIRGISTFGNSNPLFVIDGVPVFTGQGGTTNPLATLNPDDIESVEVLKDASAAAIYGARAANGVIIVTTKRGNAGKTQLSVNISGGVAAVPKSEFIDMMNSRQYISYGIEAFQNGGRPIPPSFQDPLLSKNLARNTNWQDAAFSPAIVQNYSIAISGGNDNATYFFNSGYYNQQGTLPNSGFKRYSARINSDFTIGERLTIGESVELSRGVWSGMFSPSSDFFQALLQSSPTMPVYDPDNLGGFAGPEIEYSPINRANNVGVLHLRDDETVHNELLGSVNAEYKLLPGLSYRLNLGGNIAFNNSKTFTPKYEMGNRSSTYATLSEGRSSQNVYLVENTLTYKHTFNNVHSLTLLAGFSQQKSWSRDIDGSIQDFPSNDVRTIAAGFGQSSLSGDETGWALRSEIGRLNYSYKDKYNLMLAVRRDGSSRFGKNNRYGVFPSISGNWLVTNEPFMKGIGAISSLKLRASWGQVGSQDIDNFASIATIQPYARYILGEDQTLVPGATFLQPGNSDLKWQTTTQTDIGLDLGLFNERLSFVMDYYHKRTDDILLQVPIPSTSGIRRNNGPFQNAGSIQNDGFELAVKYQNELGDLNYIISGNMSTNKNKVLKLGSNNEPIIVQRSSDPNYATTITRPGGEVGDFWGYVVEGVFKDQKDVDSHAVQPGAEPGDIRYEDLNNDGVINAEDETVIGSPFPDFAYGLNINLLYKRFDMTIFLQGKQGHDIYDLVWAGINDGEGDNNATTAMLDRWTPDHRNTNVPRAVIGDPNQNDRPSTRFVEDGSYLRIQNVQLGYNFNSDLLRSMNISHLRVYVSVKNLFTFTGYRFYNPEVGTLSGGNRSGLTRGIDYGVYPIPRTIEAGIQLKL